jgi:AraC family transcriptional regulator
MVPSDQNMLRALEFIEDNITGDLSLYDISAAAGFSVPHFYRLFRRLTGDTVGAYIERRKISATARELLKTNKTIACIAYEYGFESHDVFTRTFARVYGMTPKKFRESGGVPPLKRQTVIAKERKANNQQMNFSIIHSKEVEVVGMECNATKWDADGAIGRLWSDFLLRTGEIRNAADPMIMYGICEHENCEGDDFRYMAAIKVKCIEAIPPGMVSRSIQEKTYLQADVPDSISVPDAYTATIGYAKSLGYEIEDYDDIEVYHDVFTDPDIHSFQLLIPVRE